MNKEDLFSRITENGFDFLSKARSELEEQPKYSVIHVLHVDSKLKSMTVKQNDFMNLSVLFVAS